MEASEPSVIVSECMPDLVRLSITSLLAGERDSQKKLMWRSVLDGYDSGLITGQLDVVNAKVDYQPAYIN